MHPPADDPAVEIAGAASAAPCWSLPAEVAFRFWDGEGVCHHALTNDTHHLGALACAIVATLSSRGPAGADAVAAAIDADIDDVRRSLDELASRMLVRRC